MTYKAFNVKNMTTGLLTSRDEFLVPEDGFSKLENCHLVNGVLEKRKGHQLIDTMVSTDTGTDVTADDSDSMMGIVDHRNNGVVTMLAFNTTRANKFIGSSKTFSDLTRNIISFDHGSGQTWTPIIGDVVKGAISGAVGTIDGYWVDNGTLGTGTASGTVVFKNNTITGTFQNPEELQEDGTPSNILGDSTSIVTENLFTGDDNDFFRGVNWEGVLYVTNGVDQVRKYDGTTMTFFNLDLSTLGGPDNDLNTCRMIFLYKNRLVFLDTTESGTRHRQRVRYTESLLPNQSKSTSSIDAPTDAEIITAEFIDEDLIVWFDSQVWKLLHTGDATVPFEWRRIDRERGCVAPFSLIARGIEQVCFGVKRILHTEGRFVKEADQTINNFINTISDGLSDYSFGKYFPTLNQHWITYVDRNDTDGKPGHTLVFDWEEGDFAVYDFPVHVLGQTNATSDLFLDDLPNDVLLDDLDFSFDDVAPAGSQTLLVFGNRDGELCEFNKTDTDLGSPFTMTATWGQMNPFSSDGRLCDFGYVDFLVDVNAGVTFTVDHFLDNDTTPSTTRTITCDGDSLNDTKVWKRAYISSTAKFHKIRVTDSSTQQPRIHALTFHFRDGGNMAV